MLVCNVDMYMYVCVYFYNIITLRLRGAVYFGYGVMNIVLSLIPPKLMKLANLFGFHGNRRLGLEALEFSSKSQDMKAPLAR